MRKKWYRIANRVLSGLLVLTGFQGCSSDKDDDIICMYGTVSVPFHVVGQVTDSEGNALEGIRVSSYVQSDDGLLDFAKGSVSDERGQYHVETMLMPGERIVFEDIDGVAHGGEFVTDTLRPSEMRDDIPEGSKEFVRNVVLKRKGTE